jgi:hypothetical protein
VDAAESAVRITEVEEHHRRARPQPRHHSPKPLSFRTALAVRNLLFSADGAEASLGAGWHLPTIRMHSAEENPAQAELGRGTLETGNERDSPGHPPAVFRKHE